MTVKELILKLENYCGVTIAHTWDSYKNLDDEVVICDDGMKAEFFDVNFSCASKISKMIKEPVIEIRKEKVLRESKELTFGNWTFDEKKGIIPGKPKMIEVEEDIPVQVSPPEYESKDVFMIVTDVKNPIK